MNKGRKIFRKAASVALSSSMILAGGTSVSAAGSYQETAKTSLDSLASSVAGVVDDGAQNVEKSFKGSTGKLTLTVEDTGKAVLGSLLGQSDMSWLQDLAMDMDVSVKDGTEAVASTILLNGQKICDLNLYQNLSEMTQYMQIPEISDAYLKIDNSSDMDEDSQEFMENYMNILSDLGSVMPDGETVSTLIDRYGNIAISHMEEEKAAEETLSVEGIGEDCTVYEGTVTDDTARSMLEEILTTAKDDKEIRGLFDLWSKSGASDEDQYVAYQKGIDDLLEELGEDSKDGESSESFSEKLWVNSEDKVVGREIGLNDGTEYQPVFTLKTPSSDGQTALLLEVGADDSYVTFTGTGSSTDGLWNGDYVLAVDHTETIDINVADLELKPEKLGYYNGTFTVSFPENVSENEEDADASSMMAGFSAVVKMESDAEAETSKIALSLLTSGVSLGTLSLTGGYGEGVEIPDLSNLGTVYAVDNDEEMKAYAKNANWSTLTENLKTAGLPADLADELQQVLESAAQEASTDTGAEDGAAATDSADDSDAAA